VWRLDPGNSGDLIDRLRPHARRFTFEAAEVGEGWRPLVQECHERLQAAFPDYELLAVKQKYGALEFQALPRQWAEGRRQWTTQENADLEAITSEIRDRSEHTCEWCGAAGNHRESRKLELTLCDACNDRFPDPPYPFHGLPQLRHRRVRPHKIKPGPQSKNLGCVAHQVKPMCRTSSGARHRGLGTWARHRGLGTAGGTAVGST